MTRRRHIAILLAALTAWGCQREPLPQPHVEEATPAPSPAPVAPAAVSAPTRPAALGRIAVIGASASGGMNAVMIVPGPDREYRDQIRLGQVVGASLDGAGAVHDGADVFMFMSPDTAGRRAVEDAVAFAPSLVVAVDFLFWFGYGSVPETERLALLETGLELLDSIDAPIVVGDFPDMSAAIGGMLGRTQVPRPETLTALDARVRTWADERGDVVVVPLSNFIERVNEGRPLTIGDWTWSPGDTPLIQTDHLHPTVHGLAALLRLVVDGVVALDLASREDFELRSDVLLQRVARQLQDQRKP